MIGMDRNTGKQLSGLDHLRQSVTDILTTPLGARIMRREYGSLLPDLIDAPLNPATTVRLYAATAAALMRWEPRLHLSKVSLLSTAAGQGVIELEGAHVDTAAPVSIRLSLQLGGA